MPRYNSLTQTLAEPPAPAPQRRERAARKAPSPPPAAAPILPPITPLNGAGRQVLTIPVAMFSHLAEATDPVDAERIRHDFAAYCACIPEKGFDWRRSWQEFRGQPAAVTPPPAPEPVPVPAYNCERRNRAAAFFATL